MSRGQESDNVCTLLYTPVSCQTRKQDHQLAGIRGDGVVRVSRCVTVGVNTRLEEKNPCHGSWCTDLFREGSFLLQRGFLHENIKGFLHYNVLPSP